GRENRGQPVAPLPDPIDHPALGFFQGALSHRTPTNSRDDLERMIGAQKKVPPGEETRIARQSEILVLGPERIKLVELLHPGEFASRLEVIDDRERDQ